MSRLGIFRLRMEYACKWGLGSVDRLEKKASKSEGALPFPLRSDSDTSRSLVAAGGGTHALGF